MGARSGRLPQRVTAATVGLLRAARGGAWRLLRTGLLFALGSSALVADLGPAWAQAQDAGYAAYQRGDYAAALQQWRVDAEAGFAEAQYNVAVLYDRGQGVAQDKEQAARWYRRAATQGMGAAQFNLAVMLANGEGVLRDPVRAYMLYELAAENDREAAIRRDELARVMAPGEVGQGARLARLVREGDSADVLREALIGILPDDEYTRAQRAFLEAELAAPIQRALIALGYDPGPADGLAGPATRSAVRKFQAEVGLEQDGRLTQALLGRLHDLFDRRQAARDLRHGKGRLWRIEGEDTAPSHVFGTMHSNDDRVLSVPAPAWQAFRNARDIALEVDLSGGQDQAQARMRAYFEAMLFTDGRTLDQVVGPGLFADALAALRPYGMTEEALKRFRPWAIYEFITNPTPRSSEAEPGAPFLDLMLAQEAIGRGKSLHGLETVDEQLAVFAGMPEPQQVALLESAIDYADATGLDLETLTRLYLDGDLAGIFRLTVEPARRLGPAFSANTMERLLDARNRVMVTRMQHLLARGGAFIAVGAAHLPGEHGVLHLLEKRGYRVTRVY